MAGGGVCLMAALTFPFFGRGSTAAATHLTTPYTTLRNLSNAGALTAESFKRYPAIPESKVVWRSNDGHDHTKSPIAENSITDLQLDIRGDATYGIGRVLSQSPGTLVLFGESQRFVAVPGTIAPAVPGVVLKGTVVFAETCEQRISFPLGTFPKVFASVRLSSIYAAGLTATQLRFRLILTNITNTEFSFVFAPGSLGRDPYNAGGNGDFFVSYIAIGVAGYVVPAVTRILVKR